MGYMLKLNPRLIMQMLLQSRIFSIYDLSSLIVPIMSSVLIGSLIVSDFSAMAMIKVMTPQNRIFV